MGKGGALNAWLKEFTALVFTQTIQAFIYAIIITIILFGMVGKDESISADDNNASLGLMATFALLSVFKVEDMAKKIFGLSDSKASHKNAIQSIAKTAFAAKLGKRALDNVGKILGGTRAITKSRQDNRKARARLEEDMEDMGFKYNEKTGETSYIGKSRGTSSATTKGGSFTIGGSVPVGGGDLDIGSASGVSGGSSAYSGAVGGAEAAGTISAADKRRIRNAVRTYNDRLDEIKKSRDEGIKNIASGLVESVASFNGAVGGAIIGGADGDIGEMLQGVMAGAGVGDTIGKSTVEAVDRATKFVQRNVINYKPGISSSELKKAISSFEKAASKMGVNYGTTNIDDI